jgi:hypothetical protein
VVTNDGSDLPAGTWSSGSAATSRPGPDRRADDGRGRDEQTRPGSGAGGVAALSVALDTGVAGSSSRGHSPARAPYRENLGIPNSILKGYRSLAPGCVAVSASAAHPGRSLPGVGSDTGIFLVSLPLDGGVTPADPSQKWAASLGVASRLSLGSPETAHWVRPNSTEAEET